MGKISLFTKLLVVLVLSYMLNLPSCLAAESLTILSVASEETDGFRRYMRSATHYGYNARVLGMGQPWKGGDMNFPGGGYKVNLLREALMDLKDDKDAVVMFTDSYDVILNSPPQKVLQKFLDTKAGVLFSAEPFVWPDTSLENRYPMVKDNQKRFLNSGGIIGFAANFYAVVTAKVIQDKEDDQLFYTLVYLDEAMKQKHNLKLDHDADIFMNLNGAKSEIDLKFDDNGKAFIHNKKTSSDPLVIHGNGPSKVYLSWLGNYIADAWTLDKGCLVCEEAEVKTRSLAGSSLPKVLLAIFVERPTPFLPQFFNRIAAQQYSKKSIDIFIHFKDEYHTKHVDTFNEKFGKLYNSILIVRPDSKIPEQQARESAFHEAVRRDVDFIFSIDSIAQLTNAETLRQLIEQDRPIIAPLLSRPKKLWSNFWGDIGNDGYYLRSEDYVEIVQRTRTGVWNAPFISDAILVHRSRFSAANIPSFYKKDLDQDMAFCANQRDQGNFMYLSNKDFYGHLINPDHYNTSQLHNDMYEMWENRLDWEEKYIHPNYTRNLLPDFTLEQPCPDVYRFPILTETFTEELIEEVENNGGWSGGGHQAASDPRLATGYENVPTVDIHMNQINFHDHWIQILKDYVGPIQGKVYQGYSSRSNAIMNFVVRYKPNEQDHLKPHHDSSTFTINVALNTHTTDFEGGGCRFLRYDCSVRDTERGWALLHPGRLTHYHEGLQTTKGTRYIMVSFVDP